MQGKFFLGVQKNKTLLFAFFRTQSNNSYSLLLSLSMQSDKNCLSSKKSLIFKLKFFKDYVT